MLERASLTDKIRGEGAKNITKEEGECQRRSKTGKPVRLHREQVTVPLTSFSPLEFPCSLFINFLFSGQRSISDASLVTTIHILTTFSYPSLAGPCWTLSSGARTEISLS